MTLRAVILASLCGLLLVACRGGGDDQGQGDGSLPEDDVAASMLLVVSDFPAGWSETPDDEDDADTFEECPDFTGQSGRAETGSFSSGGSATVVHSIGVFETEDDAIDALPTLKDRGECLVDVVGRGGLNTDEVEYGEATLEAVSFPEFGDQGRTWRLTMIAKRDAQEVNVYFDLVVVRVDRYVSIVQAIDVLSPFDSSQLEELAERVAAKMNGEAKPPVVGGSAATDETSWETGAATAILEVDGADLAMFSGGTCERGRTSTGSDSFRLKVGEPGKDGEGISVGIGLDLVPGATFPGDGSGNGVQVDHGGRRWGLAAGVDAIAFNDDLSGGSIQVADEADKSDIGAVRFTC